MKFVKLTMSQKLGNYPFEISKETTKVVNTQIRNYKISNNRWNKLKFYVFMYSKILVLKKIDDTILGSYDEWFFAKKVMWVILDHMKGFDEKIQYLYPNFTFLEWLMVPRWIKIRKFLG